MHSKKMLGKVLYHIIVCGIGLIMIYPLVWMVCSSFKPTSTIFQTAGSLIPEQFTLENYANGWRLYFWEVFLQLLLPGDSCNNWYAAVFCYRCIWFFPL